MDTGTLPQASRPRQAACFSLHIRVCTCIHKRGWPRQPAPGQLLAFPISNVKMHGYINTAIIPWPLTIGLSLCSMDGHLKCQVGGTVCNFWKRMGHTAASCGTWRL